MSAEEGLFKFKKAKNNANKKRNPKFGRKKQKNEAAEESNLGNVNPKGKIQKRKRNKFPHKPQVSDGKKKYDLKQLEEKISKLNEVSEPNKKVRKKLRQLEHLHKKISQIILTQQALEGEKMDMLNSIVVKETVDPDDSNESDDQMEEEDENGEANESDEAEESDVEANESDEEPNKSDEEPNKSDEEPNESDEEPNESDEEPDESDDEPKKKNGKKVSAEESSDDDDPKTPKRFVVFVGNLAKEVTEEDITKHFAKVGQLKSVRIPGKKENRKSGFAFVELDDQLTYEKTLSMHHTMMNNRRINVMYTKPESKTFDKKEIMKKNAKLDAMRKAGQLAGSVPEHQRRSFRRKKKRLAEAKAAADAKSR